MEIGEHFHKTVVHKNCRNFFKRIYDVPVSIEKSFLLELKSFGQLEINEFSKIIPIAKDTFIVKGKNGTEIRGVIGDKSILLVTPKDDKSDYESFETVLSAYIKLHVKSD